MAPQRRDGRQGGGVKDFQKQGADAPRSPVVVMRQRSFIPVVVALAAALSWLSAAGDTRIPDDAKPDAIPPVADQPAEPEKALLSGRVIALSAALKERGIKCYEPELEGQFVLETDEKELIPIVPDWRGRAFFQDERLRDRRVELIVKRRPGVPWVQVLSIYLFDEADKRNIMDYWCDICSIPMYEIKACECCQAPIRLRLRPQDLPREFQATSPRKAASKGTP